MNFSTSSVFFSSNPTNNETLQLSKSLGIKRTNELGMYLGHNVHHQGRRNRANNKLVERVIGRHDGWKTKCLSKAGFLTLAKSAINTMGVFQMPVQRLPVIIHKELDTYARSCFWGEFDSKRKVHLVSWEVLRKSKEDGGFGLNGVERMNMALLTKLC